MKTLKQISNQSTTGQGTLKSTVWTTALAEALNAGELRVLPDNLGTITINEQEINLSAVVGTAFEGVYSNKNPIDLDSQLGLWAEDFLSNLQRNNAGAESTPPLADKSVISADQYRTNCIKLALDSKNAEVVAEIVEDILNLDHKATKDTMSKILDRVLDTFFNLEQREVYQVKVEKEEADRERFKDLTDAGFTSINASNGTITANVPVAVTNTALPELAKLGFTLIKSDFDATTLQVNVVFEEGKTEVPA